MNQRRIALFLAALSISLFITPPSNASAAEVWTSRTSAADNDWRSVTYGNGIYVAVASSGTGNRVMTSPDGITWTSRSSAADLFWISVTYGNGLFVAVARTISAVGTNNRVMTSPDGITWTIRTSAADYDWVGITYGNGTFVAVANAGAGNRVMTSPDGITWTLRASANDASGWFAVAYGAGTFVAVAFSGTDRVMTSPDGITWTARSAAANLLWLNLIYANDLFIALANDNAPNNSFMTSPDGITWTRRDHSFDVKLTAIAYGGGKFYAVSSFVTGKPTLVISSADAITWESQTSASDNNWRSIVFANNLFVAVAFSGTGNRVMTFSVASAPPSDNSETTPSAAELEARRQRAIALKRSEVQEAVKNKRILTLELLNGADLPTVNGENLNLVNVQIVKLSDLERQDLNQVTTLLDKYATIQKLGSEYSQSVSVRKLVSLGIIENNLYQKQYALGAIRKEPESKRDSLEEIQEFFQTVSSRVIGLKDEIRKLQQRLNSSR